MSGTLFIDGVPFKMYSEDNTFLKIQISEQPEIIPAMKAGSAAELVFRASDGNDYNLKFSLSGFTASALKMSERCDFNVFNYAQKASARTTTKSTIVPNLSQSEADELLEILEASYGAYRVIEAICKGYFPQDNAVKFISEAMDAAIAYYKIEPSRVQAVKDEAWTRSANFIENNPDMSTTIQMLGFTGKSEQQNMCIQYVDRYEGMYTAMMSKFLQSAPGQSKRKF